MWKLTNRSFFVCTRFLNIKSFKEFSKTLIMQLSDTRNAFEVINTRNIEDNLWRLPIKPQLWSISSNWRMYVFFFFFMLSYFYYERYQCKIYYEKCLYDIKHSRLYYDYTSCEVMSFMIRPIIAEAWTIFGKLVIHSNASLVAISPIPTKEAHSSIGYAELMRETCRCSSNVGT